LVDFNVLLELDSDSRFRVIHYTAEFLNGDGEHTVLNREARIESRLFQYPYTTAWLLSHILGDFMAEVSAG
jgi:hypothetical protein